MKEKVKRYKPRHVVIEAVEFTGPVSYEKMCSQWQYFRSQSELVTVGVTTPYINIKTPEGLMMADIGNFVIEGTHGEFYPCKAEVFRTKYEEVTDE